MSVPRLVPELTIELSLEEILEDLCWPNPPPGRWGLSTDGYSPNGRPTVSARRSDSSRSRKRASGSTPSASSIVL